MHLSIENWIKTNECEFAITYHPSDICWWASAKDNLRGTTYVSIRMLHQFCSFFGAIKWKFEGNSSLLYFVKYLLMS